MKRNLASLVLLSTVAASTAHAQEFFDFSEYLRNSQTNINDLRSSQSQILYVSANGLRVRATPEDNGKVMGVLSLNERVRVVSPDLVNGKYIQIEILRSVNKIEHSLTYFVAREFLSEKVTDYKEFTGDKFIILNVATETLRIYERVCADNSCPHKMIMETEVVVGEDKNLPKEAKGKGRSILGSYRITGWAKFYQDAGGHYPAWYKDGYPDVPAYGDNDWRDWMKNKYMPRDERGKAQGDMRGAFGWYAAFKAPNAYGQWLHGTIGWGADKDKYIAKTKKLLTNLVSNPRSAGCTRNNNEAIAYIRQLAETGTPVIKIYAREAVLDHSLSDYTEETKNWDYILTKRSGQKSDRAEVQKALGLTTAEVDAFWAAKLSGAGQIIDPKSPLNQILEVGTYSVQTKPSVIKYTPGEKMGKIKRSVGRKGNVYGVKTENMSNGVFYVDAGLTSAYSHPTAILDVGGFEDETIPEWMDYKHVMNK